MTYSHTGYKIDNNKSLILLNLYLRDCHTQHNHNRHLKMLRNLTNQHDTEHQCSANSFQNINCTTAMRYSQ